MIALVEGTVAERGGDRVVIVAGGVGYEVLVPASTMATIPPPGRTIRLLTHLYVRDDAMTLFGFTTPSERELFLLLVSVNGIGPKVALAILSVLTPEAIRRSVLDGDADAITIVPGVGKKVAARIVLDLKEKFGGDVELPAAGPVAEVREALIAMGLSPQEVHDAVAGLEPDGQPVEELLRESLRRVGAR